MRAALVAALAVGSFTPLAAQANSVDSIASTLRGWVAGHHLVGIAAGWIDSTGTQHVVAGTTRSNNGVAIDENTTFEIGSITKAFTGLLLADMVLRGEVALDDPAAKYLPGWALPKFNGREITLLDLATQSSGLPRLPDNFQPANAADPYADYGDARLRAFLEHYQLTRAPGAKYDYSNLGMGLLGRVLAARAGNSYESLVRARILDRLGMNSTRITVDSSAMRPIAEGNSAALDPVAAWHFDALQGAGALHSSLRDLLKLATALRDTTSGPLARVIAFAIRPRRSIEGADSIGLAWHHMRVSGEDIVWHNGATAGFRSWLSADLKARRAVVVLANGGGVPADAIGVALQRQLQLPPPAAAPERAVAVAAGSLSRLVGRYELSPQFAIDITEEHDTLWAQATAQPRYPVFAASATEFFYRVVAARLVFQADTAGRITGLVLHQNGTAMPGRRVP